MFASTIFPPDPCLHFVVLTKWIVMELLMYSLPKAANSSQNLLHCNKFHIFPPAGISFLVDFVPSSISSSNV